MLALLLVLFVGALGVPSALAQVAWDAPAFMSNWLQQVFQTAVIPLTLAAVVVASQWLQSRKLRLELENLRLEAEIAKEKREQFSESLAVIGTKVDGQMSQLHNEIAGMRGEITAKDRQIAQEQKVEAPQPPTVIIMPPAPLPVAQQGQEKPSVSAVSLGMAVTIPEQVVPVEELPEKPKIITP